MKKYLLNLLSVIPLFCAAQTDLIEFINHPYYKSSPLEKQKIKLSVKVRGLGYGGADSYLEISGNKSKLNINEGDSVYFLLKMNDNLTGNLSLYKSEVTKNSRRVKYYKQRTFSGASIGGETISYNISLQGGDIYRVVPSQKLEAGEYMFVLQGFSGGMGEAFPFSVGEWKKEEGPKVRKSKKFVDDVYGN